MKPAAQTQKYFYPTYQKNQSVNIFERFLLFAEKQEKNHFGWVGGSIMLQASVLFPLTLLVIVGTGGAFTLIAFAIAALAMVVVSNLAALPTKVTIPTLVLSTGIDIILVILALA